MLAALWIACKLVVAPLLALVAAIAVWFKVHGKFTSERFCHDIPGTRVLKLPSGRQVAFIDGGDTNGPAVVFWHGTPGCRGSYRDVLEPAATRAGLRLITIDRPGVGLTSPLPAPPATVLDNVCDVGPVLQSLGVKRFAVAGQSGGGPHVLGCMDRYRAQRGAGPAAGGAPQPVCVAGFVTGGPGDTDHPSATRKMMLVNRMSRQLAKRWPWGYWNLHKLLSPFTTNTPKLTRLVLAGMSEKDRAVALAGDSSIQHFNQLVAEGTRQGTDAMAREMFLFFRAPFPWGVNVDHILDTPCWWWSGSDDRNCDGESGVVASKNQLRPMRRLVVKVFEDEGHMGPVLQHTDEIMALLKGALQRRP